jgi:hypothetical protein
MSAVRYRDEEGGFALVLADGWSAGRDEEGGLLLSAADGAGLLHLIAFEREEAEEADPAEELYAFLEDQEIELEEDEVEDFELHGTGSMALCEYLAEDAEETTFWLVGVATAPGRLVFVSYSSPAEAAEEEREAVRAMLATLSLGDPSPG